MHIATFRHAFGTLFHHAPEALSVSTLAVAVIGRAQDALLVATPSLTKLAPARFNAASLRAVPIAPIAVRTEVKHLLALDQPAHDEAKRLHVPDPGTGENLGRPA